MYIKLPMYLFLYIALGLNDYEGANPLLGPSTFLGSNGTRSAHCHFRDQKSHDFQGPNLPMGLVMDLPASKSLRPEPYIQ
jgi:hypothetical protein